MRAAGFILAGLIALLVLAWIVFRLWPLPDRPHAAGAPQVSVAGTPSGRNLIGIQPWLEELDYRSAGSLYTALGAYLETAREAGVLTPQSVVVFPEHTGTWLVAAHAPSAVYSAPGVEAAMVRLVAARPLAFAGAFLRSREADRAAAAVFRANGARMAQAYQQVFSRLAAEYGVTIAAGSIVLPDPHVREGRLEVRRAGPLYNVSAVFAPDGSIHPELVRKAYPIPSERGFTAAAPVPDYPVFDTPAGRLGVLICADSWHPDVYAALRDRGAELLAVPAFLQPSGVWDRPWGGYTTPWPDDAPRADAGRLTEGEAWQTHAPAGRLSGAGAQAGLTTFLRGELWDLGSDGRAILVDAGGVTLGPDTDGPAISVLWVDG